GGEVARSAAALFGSLARAPELSRGGALRVVRRDGDARRRDLPAGAADHRRRGARHRVAPRGAGEELGDDQQAGRPVPAAAPRRAEMNLGPILTAANQLTLLRMLMVPFFVILVIYGYRGWALVVFFTAGLTDLFDGLI